MPLPSLCLRSYVPRLAAAPAAGRDPSGPGPLRGLPGRLRAKGGQGLPNLPFPLAMQAGVCYNKATGGERMRNDWYRQARGKRLRRGYGSAALPVLGILALAIPYAIFVISLCTGRFEPSAWPSTLWISVGICLGFSAPFLLLLGLSRCAFGRVICVLTPKGLRHPGGFLRWETIDRIEYALDSRPRFPGDARTVCRAVVFTRGGEHVVLRHAPFCLLSRARKYRRDLAVRVSGAASWRACALVLALILAAAPFYVALLVRAPGLTAAQGLVLVAVVVAVGLIRMPVFDAYAVEYRFWRRILPRKRLSCLILGCFYLLFFAAVALLFWVPEWALLVPVGILIGAVQPPVPSRSGLGNRPLLSYAQLYDMYINHADVWEKRLGQRRKQ